MQHRKKVREYQPLKVVTPSKPAADVVISDEDSDIGDVPGGPANAAGGHGCMGDTSQIVIFRVPHKHPHMLKRPLQHVDALSGLDLAVRIYEVAGTGTSPEDGGSDSWWTRTQEDPFVPHVNFQIPENNHESRVLELRL